MGFTKNGCLVKMLKTQGSKEILMEMDEGRLRSLEKCFFVRRNGEMKKKNQEEKKVNSVNGGREVDEDEAKREK